MRSTRVSPRGRVPCLRSRKHAYPGIDRIRIRYGPAGFTCRDTRPTDARPLWPCRRSRRGRDADACLPDMLAAKA